MNNHPLHRVVVTIGQMHSLMNSSGTIVNVRHTTITLLPALMGRKQRNHEYYYWEFLKGGGAQTIRKGKFKAVRRGVTMNPDASLELYKLTSDPGETTGLAEENPQVV